MLNSIIDPKVNQSNAVSANIKRLSDFLVRLVGVLCIVLMTLLVAIVILGVFFRYVLTSPLSWSEEISRYLMIWIAFLAASIPLRKWEHVALEVIVQLLPSTLRKVIKIIMELMILVFLAVLTKQGLNLVKFAALQTSPSLGISMMWVYLAAPVGGMIMLLQLLIVMVEDIIGGGDRT